MYICRDVCVLVLEFASLNYIFFFREFYIIKAIPLTGCILGFLDRSRYFSFPVAPQLYSRG
jgi:hypothetical protein